MQCDDHSHMISYLNGTTHPPSPSHLVGGRTATMVGDNDGVFEHLSDAATPLILAGHEGEGKLPTSQLWGSFVERMRVMVCERVCV